MAADCHEPSVTVESLELLTTQTIIEEMMLTLAAGFDALIDALKAMGSLEREH